MRKAHALHSLVLHVPSIFRDRSRLLAVFRRPLIRRLVRVLARVSPKNRAERARPHRLPDLVVAGTVEQVGVLVLRDRRFRVAHLLRHLHRVELQVEDQVRRERAPECVRRNLRRKSRAARAANLSPHQHPASNDPLEVGPSCRQDPQGAPQEGAKREPQPFGAAWRGAPRPRATGWGEAAPGALASHA